MGRRNQGGARSRGSLCELAQLRGARVPHLIDLQHPQPRFCPGPLRHLRKGRTGRFFMQGKRFLPVLRRPSHGRHRRPRRGSPPAHASRFASVFSRSLSLSATAWPLTAASPARSAPCSSARSSPGFDVRHDTLGWVNPSAAPSRFYCASEVRSISIPISTFSRSTVCTPARDFSNRRSSTACPTPPTRRSPRCSPPFTAASSHGSHGSASWPPNPPRITIPTSPCPSSPPPSARATPGRSLDRIALGHERGVRCPRVGRQPAAPFVTLAGACCAA